MQNRFLTAAASGLLAATLAVPALAEITATAPGYQMMHELETALAEAVDELGSVRAYDLRLVNRTISQLRDDAVLVLDAFYPGTGVAADVCSRDEIVAAMDELLAVLDNYVARVGANDLPADIETALARLRDRLDDIDDRLDDALDRGQAGC